MKQRKGLNRFLMVIFTISLVLLSYFNIVKDNFATAAKAAVFLNQAKTYYYASEIIKAKINDNLPDSIKENVLKAGVASKLIDLVVTPEVVAKVSKPALNAAYRVAKAPTEIVDDKVVIDTTKYKEQVNSQINQYDLPQGVKDVANSVISAVPKDLTLVDLEQHPNSLLGMLVKIKTLFAQIGTTITVLWWVVAISLISMLIINLRMFKRLFNSLAISFASAGVFMIVGSFVLPYVFRYLLPKSSDPLIGDYVNGLANAFVRQIFVLSRMPAIWFVVIGAVLYGLYKVLPLDKFQKWFDRTFGLKKSTAKK